MNADPVIFAKALADETRQEIMKHLCCVWLSVNDIVERLDGKVNQPTVSHHLKKLEDAGLVLVREEGRHHFYTLNQEQMTVCCGMLVQRFAPEHVSDFIPVEDVAVWSAPPFPFSQVRRERKWVAASRRKRALRRHLKRARELLRKGK